MGPKSNIPTEQSSNTFQSRCVSAYQSTSPPSRMNQQQQRGFRVASHKIPITKGISYHSIIGDRGRGDSPNSSDGVVAYWSSHLDGAKSERIVPSGHGS